MLIKANDTLTLISFNYKFHFKSTVNILCTVCTLVPIPGAARSKTWVFGFSLAGIAGSNPTGGVDVCFL